MNTQRHILCFAAIAFAMSLVGMVPSSHAQSPATKSSDSKKSSKLIKSTDKKSSDLAESMGNSESVDTLSKQQEKALINSIYKQTETATSASDYTKLISDCREALKKKLSDGNSAYLKSLESWSLNRRGHARCDLAKFMIDVKNVDQANDILDEADSDFKTALELNAKLWRAQIGMGNVHVMRGAPEKAIESFTAICESFPKEPTGWFNRAEVHYQLGQFEKALADYDQVLLLSGSDLQAVTGKAHCLFQLGRTAEALTEYQVISKLMPNNSWALINTADAHQALGNWSEAYDCYFAAMKAKPIAEGYQKTAWMLATCPDSEFNRPEMALNLANKAIEMAGETELNLETLAAALAAGGDFEAAKKSQEKAIAKSGEATESQTERLELFKSQNPIRQERVADSTSSDSEKTIRNN